MSRETVPVPGPQAPGPARSGAGTAPSVAVAPTLRSPGRRLDSATRAFFAPRFGPHVDGVRVHTGPDAERSAEALDAEAFTIGSRIVLGRGVAAEGVLRGARLLAHELAHVAQQSESAGPGLRIQRQPRRQRQPQSWLPELDAILPGVGLVAHIDRVTTLLDVFGAALLEEQVRRIHADAAATRLTQSHGVSGIVALYDSRQGDRIDVAAARQALRDMPDRYGREALARLRFAPSPEPSSFWFQDPASQRPAASTSGAPTTGSQLRARVHVEAQLSRVGTGVAVRFAYPESEVSRGGASRRVQRAKQSILQAIAQIAADLGSLPPAASRSERREQQRVRARLGEALRGTSTSSPLNVFIATEPTRQELLGQIAAFTDRVFVDLQDVGDPARLQAAIRVPLLLIEGGLVPGQGGAGGAQQIPAATAADLQRTLLHEALHTLLIRQSRDAEAIWRAHRARLTVEGSPSAAPMLVELVRKYLIAQEEVFAYDHEATLYPPVSPERARYDTFVRNVAGFLTRRRLTLDTVTLPISVSQRVARRAVTWSITYRVPAGTVNLAAPDIRTLDFLLSSYPLA